MAAVQLADVYEPTTFNQVMQEQAVELNAFVQSGVLLTSPQLTSMAAVGGRTGELPFYQGLANDEPNYSTDDPASDSVPAKIGDGIQTWRLAAMNKSWSTMDLSRELALADPLGAITNRIGFYWQTALSRRLIKSALGVLADNVANDSGDMRYSIATDAAGAITTAELVSNDAIIAAAGTMGDHAAKLSVIAMHSVVYQRLQSQNLITFIPFSDQTTRIPTYLGYRVVVDDAMPAVAGTNRITYTTILFSEGAFAHGIGAPPVPSELERKAASGDGGGQDIIHTRQTHIVHPVGFTFTSSSVSGVSPTEAELATAANWNRVYANRKNIGVAFLQTNG
jgi:hypothetical protein